MPSHHSPSILLFFLSFSLSFMPRLVSPRSSNSPGAMQPSVIFQPRERERKSDGRKIRRFIGRSKGVSRRGETEIKSKRKRREREREREGFVAGIYFSSSISQAGYRVRDGYLYVCKVIAPGWRTSASATCRVHLIAKVHPPSHPPSPPPNTPLATALTLMVDRSAERQVRGNGVGKNNLPSIHLSLCAPCSKYASKFVFAFLLLSLFFFFKDTRSQFSFSISSSLFRFSWDQRFQSLVVNPSWKSSKWKISK